MMIKINLISDYNLAFGVDGLSSFMLVFVNLFGFLVYLYSRDYMKGKKLFFVYLLLLVVFSNLVFLSKDFISLVFAWGATLALLYAMLALGSGSTAKRALCLVGAADFSLILGVCLYIAATGSIAMPPTQLAKLPLDGSLAWISFLLMTTGALAKAGCGPFHTWIPDAAESAPMPVMAILPASLDKLLGIYLLARICVDFFALSGMALALLLVIGGLTIMFAVMMALIQHDLRKLLSYHAISQVGYMVLGFGTGIPIGIAGGLFHMLNHAIYKTGLFLTAGAVGHRKNTFELEKLGALANYMPVTFVCGLIFSLSISGVPPFNGFASKWMLYQGAIAGLTGAGNALRPVFIFALTAAMFGSALTLASFVKVMYAVFLDKDNSDDKKPPKEVSLSMRIPLVVLAGLCVLFGVFPGIFLNNVMRKWFLQPVDLMGSWNSLFAFGFIGLGLALGYIVWSSTSGKKATRTDGYYIGGETTPLSPGFPSTEFYRTVEENAAMAPAYLILKNRALDIYNILKKTLTVLSCLFFVLIDRTIDFLTGFAANAVLGASWVFRRLHTGVLDLYVVWSLAGLVILFFILMGLK